MSQFTKKCMAIHSIWMAKHFFVNFDVFKWLYLSQNLRILSRGGGGGVLPYKGLMGTCGQPRYVFRNFCLKQGIKFISVCLNQGIDLSIFVLNKISLLGR